MCLTWIKKATFLLHSKCANHPTTLEQHKYSVLNSHNCDFMLKLGQFSYNVIKCNVFERKCKAVTILLLQWRCSFTFLCFHPSIAYLDRESKQRCLERTPSAQPPFQGVLSLHRPPACRIGLKHLTWEVY